MADRKHDKRKKPLIDRPKMVFSEALIPLFAIHRPFKKMPPDSPASINWFQLVKEIPADYSDS